VIDIETLDDEDTEEVDNEDNETEVNKIFEFIFDLYDDWKREFMPRRKEPLFFFIVRGSASSGLTRIHGPSCTIKKI
jgi:hypothetical protein